MGESEQLRGEPCRHNDKAVKVIGRQFGCGETAQKKQSAQLAGLDKQLNDDLKPGEQKLPARGCASVLLANLFKGESCSRRMLVHASSFSSALASLRSAVANPSVNQP